MHFPHPFLTRCLLPLLPLLALLPANLHARPAPKKAHAAAPTEYKGAIVMDAATGNVLVEDRADVVTPPASMAKLMTFAVVSDHLARGTIALDTPVKIADEDAGIGGTQVFLDPRETFPVEDLIYAMMIPSANDAAHALARVTAGSVEAFVGEMNAKARELGMTHTTFRTPHGLPPSSRRISDGDLTTPRDYALLCRHLVLNTDILKYSAAERDFGLSRPEGPMHMINHNKLLGRVAGIDGLKTGFTDGAGYCLSATAERNGHRLIVVIMGAFGPGGQHDLGKARDLKAIELFERGFALLPAGSPQFTRVAAANGPAPAAAASPISPAPLANVEKEMPVTGSSDAMVKFSMPAKMK